LVTWVLWSNYTTNPHYFGLINEQKTLAYRRAILESMMSKIKPKLNVDAVSWAGHQLGREPLQRKTCTGHGCRWLDIFLLLKDVSTLRLEILLCLESAWDKKCSLRRQLGFRGVLVLLFMYHLPPLFALFVRWRS